MELAAARLRDHQDAPMSTYVSSSMTSTVLKCWFFAANQSANANIPDDVLAGLKNGRSVVLQKRNGGVRALVMSDVFHRLVGRALA